MNILVIGNGFDLAHKLPTKYEHFLKYINAFNRYKNVRDQESIKGELEAADEENKKYIVNLVKLYDQKKKLFEELNGLVSNNKWIEYFWSVYENKKEKDGWIDFENEISEIIKSLDADRRGEDFYGQVKFLSNKYLEKTFLYKGYEALFEDELEERGGKQKITYEEIRDILYKDLNKLIRALEIYLADYVDKECETCEYILPDIKEKHFDAVLSFNYTDTFMRLYDLEEKSEYDYIHGKADIKNDVDICNLVLGIDEYLPEGEKDTDNKFIEFKKFYQRIYKRTGCKYMDWLDESGFVVQGDGYDDADSDLNIYILGHSLDVTDKDILSKLINAKEAKTTIFYHDKKALGNQIANLVKVIGQDNLISRVHGSNATIFFKEQKAPIMKMITHTAYCM